MEERSDDGAMGVPGVEPPAAPKAREALRTLDLGPSDASTGAVGRHVGVRPRPSHLVNGREMWAFRDRCARHDP